MGTVKDHYDSHLGHFYSWMLGDFEVAKEHQKKILLSQSLPPSGNKLAIDLGCGNGIQSVALTELGFEVYAIDFNDILLDELTARKNKLIHPMSGNLMEFDKLIPGKVELIVCMGDTLTHLEDEVEVAGLINKCFKQLERNGRLVLSFRDLTTIPEGSGRFIPVKSDDKRIHTCFLEDVGTKVMVYDILHEKKDDQWIQKISGYPKLKLSADKLIELLERPGFKITFKDSINRMTIITSSKI